MAASISTSEGNTSMKYDWTNLDEDLAFLGILLSMLSVAFFFISLAASRCP